MRYRGGGLFGVFGLCREYYGDSKGDIGEGRHPHIGQYLPNEVVHVPYLLYGKFMGV